jgi:hypothetical protein
MRGAHDMPPELDHLKKQLVFRFLFAYNGWERWAVPPLRRNSLRAQFGGDRG